MAVEATPVFELTNIYHDGEAAMMPFYAMADRRGFDSAVATMARQRGYTATDADLSRATLGFVGDIRAAADVVGRTRYDRRTDSTALQVSLGSAYEDYDIWQLSSVLRERFDEVDFCAHWGIAASKSLFHEASHLADTVIDGGVQNDKNQDRHERRYTRRFRIPAVMGVTAILGTALHMAANLRNLFEQQSPLSTAFVAVGLLGGLAVIGGMVDSGVHRLARRTKACYMSNPQEIRAYAAEDEYSKQLREGTAEPLVTIRFKTARPVGTLDS